MSLTVPTASRNAMCNALVDLLDIGSGQASGDLQFHTAAFATLLATLLFSNPAFGNAATGVATANAITADSSADASGTAAVWRARDRDAATVLEGTAGTSGADINFNTVTWTAGDNISVSSLTITVPAT
jgi:hypothetical protein